MCHPRILDAVEALIGPNIQLHHSKLNLKPPRAARPASSGTRTTRSSRTRTTTSWPCSIHLDEATKENGCLRIIPGSHKQGPADARLRQGRRLLVAARRPGCPGRRVVWHYAECPAGGVEIHHCNMLHSSTANRGTNPRSVLIFQYRAADNVAAWRQRRRIRPRHDRARRQPVRGARMLDGTIVKLPGEIKDPLQRDG